MKRSRPKPRRGPRKRKAPEWTPEDWAIAEPVLMARCAWRCERCERLLAGGLIERHHRQRRRDGGDRYVNLLVLCGTCHPYVHAHPEESRTQGWIVSAYEAEPAAVPVRINGYWFHLTDHGTKVVVP